MEELKDFEIPETKNGVKIDGGAIDQPPPAKGSESDRANIAVSIEATEHTPQQRGIKFEVCKIS
jgi:hypothetical protein